MRIKGGFPWQRTRIVMRIVARHAPDRCARRCPPAITQSETCEQPPFPSSAILGQYSYGQPTLPPGDFRCVRLTRTGHSDWPRWLQANIRSPARVVRLRLPVCLFACLRVTLSSLRKGVRALSSGSARAALSLQGGRTLGQTRRSVRIFDARNREFPSIFHGRRALRNPELAIKVGDVCEP